mmetsp:Transcript_9651/g.30604  ORF Transcript_9651/g.30604 Transcript_9651/m.30604 type:complete len:423 (+) Transcript_9651:188-1456(+)
MAVADSCSSSKRARRRSRCSVKLVYWSAAFLLTWAYRFSLRDTDASERSSCDGDLPFTPNSSSSSVDSEPRSRIFRAYSSRCITRAARRAKIASSADSSTCSASAFRAPPSCNSSTCCRTPRACSAASPTSALSSSMRASAAEIALATEASSRSSRAAAADAVLAPRASRSARNASARGMQLDRSCVSSAAFSSAATARAFSVWSATTRISDSRPSRSCSSARSADDRPRLMSVPTSASISAASALSCSAALESASAAAARSLHEVVLNSISRLVDRVSAVSSSMSWRTCTSSVSRASQVLSASVISASREARSPPELPRASSASASSSRHCRTDRMASKRERRGSKKPPLSAPPRPTKSPSTVTQSKPDALACTVATSTERHTRARANTKSTAGLMSSSQTISSTSGSTSDDCGYAMSDGG